MLVVAIAGLVANAASAWVLSRGSDHEHNLNTRGAFLHVVGDLLGSVSAIVAALVMLATGWYLADPLLSVVIGLLILWSSWRLLRESVDVLLEATPQGIDAREVRSAMADVKGVSGVHDLHIWTVTSGLICLSAHVEVEHMRDWNDALTALRDLLRERFGVAHATLQPESAEEAVGLSDRCSLETEEGRNACVMALPAAAKPVGQHYGHRH